LTAGVRAKPIPVQEAVGAKSDDNNLTIDRGQLENERHACLFG
jgi:hypothetical protein